MDILKQKEAIEEGLARLIDAVIAVEDSVLPPEFVDVNGMMQFRHSKKDKYLAAYLKILRSVSDLNAAICLLNNGFAQQVMAMLRMVDDFLWEVLFLLEDPESEKPNQKQEQFLQDFYQEEFVNPANPLLNEKRRCTVPKKKIWSSSARQGAPFANYNDLRKSCQVVSDGLSGYVHGAYPHIMEMYGGNPPSFHVTGMLGSPRIAECIDQLSIYTQRTISVFGFFAKAVGSEPLSKFMTETRDRFEATIGFIPSTDLSSGISNQKRKK